MVAKKNKNQLLPQLRFPEFNGRWNDLPLRDVAERITTKVGSKTLTPVSITAGKGFVDQAKKFGRNISGAQYKNYIHLRRGEFAYNKGNSKTFPQGCVYQLKEFEEVAASTAFICFKLNQESVDDFYQSLFEHNVHGRRLYKHITSSARSDGLLNISPDTFFNIELPTPPTFEEQRKIADCLSSIDSLIAAHSSKLDALRDHKKGLLQQLFPAEGETTPELRFPEFRDAGEWGANHLGGVCTMKAGKFINASSIVEKNDPELYPCFGGNGLRGYTKSYTHEGVFPLIGRQGAHCGNIQMAEGKFHATEHAVVTESLDLNPYWLFFALTRMNLNQYATGQAQPGLSVDVLEKLQIKYPKLSEQKRIGDCLRGIDSLINTETKILGSLADHKNGLMQQLFPNPEDAKR